MGIKTIKWLALITACAALTTQSLEGQVYSTVKDTYFVLTAITQTAGGRATTVRVTNKDILAALNATGAFQFGSGASLLLRSVNGGLPTFEVREISGDQVTTHDVSSYLVLTEPGNAVHSQDSLVNWGIWDFTLKSGGGIDFDLWGLTTLYTGAIPTGGGGDLLRTVSLSSYVSGPGHLQGAASQWWGAIYANHARVD
jgi:hypothetical protein